MTIAAASALDSIRAQLCEVCDMLETAIDAADGCPNPEWAVIRQVRRMADALVGAVNELVPTTQDDPWADLKDALSNLAATGYDMTSLRVSFATKSLIVYWHTGAPTIDSFRAPAAGSQVTPADLPAGPMEPAAAEG